MSRRLQCPNCDFLELQTVDFEANRGCRVFSSATGHPRAAGGNAGASVRVFHPRVASSTAKLLRLQAANGRSIVSGAAWRASIRGDRQMGHERKLTVASRCCKMVRNARGNANCARAQEGGGGGEALFSVQVLSSWATRVQTARFRSSRRHCTFIAAAEPRGVKMSD